MAEICLVFIHGPTNTDLERQSSCPTIAMTSNSIEIEGTGSL